MLERWVRERIFGWKDILLSIREIFEFWLDSHMLVLIGQGHTIDEVRPLVRVTL